MKRCLRRLRTELHHRYDESFGATKGRRECAFEVHLRDRLLEATCDTAARAEACLEELRRQEAMLYAPYKPGDRLLVEYQVDRATLTRGPYLIIEVCPDKRGGFHYEAAELTKKGTMHARRAPHWLSPRLALTMRLSDAPVCEDAEREASIVSAPRLAGARV